MNEETKQKFISFSDRPTECVKEGVAILQKVADNHLRRRRWGCAKQVIEGECECEGEGVSMTVCERECVCV